VLTAGLFNLTHQGGPLALKASPGAVLVMATAFQLHDFEACSGSRCCSQTLVVKCVRAGQSLKHFEKHETPGCIVTGLQL